MASSIEKIMGNKLPETSPSTAQSRNSHERSVNDKSANFIEISRDDLATEGYIVKNAKNETVEEYRLIKRRLLKSIEASRRQGLELSNFILVTSALQGDGKTFTATNLALSIAMEMDKTALLIDADVLKSGVSRTLGITSERGFIDLLGDKSPDFRDLVYKTDIENLTVLPSGKSSLRTTELFSSESMATLCQELSYRYSDRIIIMDSPPLLQTTESQALANVIPNIVFVVSADHTPTAAIANAMELIDKDKKVNFVLNKTRTNNTGAYYYYNTQS